jgi:hypothetical protein
MKKTVLILVTVLLIGLFFSSCKTSEKCPAYGESHKFQVEQKY